MGPEAPGSDPRKAGHILVCQAAAVGSMLLVGATENCRAAKPPGKPARK